MRRGWRTTPTYEFLHLCFEWGRMSPLAMLEIPKFWRVRMGEYLRHRARMEEVDRIETQNARQQQ